MSRGGFISGGILTPGVPFAPTDISGAISWYRKGINIDPTGWTNDLLLGHNLSFIGTPTISGGGVVFNGTSQRGRVTFTLNQPHSWAIRFSVPAFNTNHNICDGIGTNTAGLQMGASSPDLGLVASGTPFYESTSMNTSGLNSVVSVFNGASSSVTVNGVTATGNPGAANAGGTTIGANGPAAGVTFTACTVYELIIYNVAVNAGQITQLTTYLNTL